MMRKRGREREREKDDSHPELPPTLYPPTPLPPPPLPPPRPHIPPHPTRHIERDDGPVMQFHSFYRDIRSELTGINGWSQNLGRYMREAEYK